MELLFWVCGFFCFYTYVGHLLLLWLLTRVHPQPWSRSEIRPSVTVYISAFNEERIILEKIRNLLEQDYEGALDVLVVDDHSEDNTRALVESTFVNHSQVSVVRAPHNRGKAANQNDFLPRLSTEIVILTDATSKLPSDGIRKIVANFSDANVGCVAVDIEFLKQTGGSIERGQSGYWLYERALRIFGALAWTNIVCSGTCYAMRLSSFKPIPEDIAEDLVNPLSVAFSSQRVVFDTTVIVTEESNVDLQGEARMRRRVAVRNVTALFRYWRYLNPKFGFAAYQLAVHKYMRCTCWIPMMLLVLSNTFLLNEFFYQVIFALQIAFYALAATGYLADRLNIKSTLLFVPYYFFLMNFAYLLATYDYARGVRRTSWSTHR